MATTKTFLDLTGLSTLVTEIKKADATTLTSAKSYTDAEIAKLPAQTDYSVTVDTSATTAGYLKSYTFSQNGSTLATIDIPKDLVVTAGEIVVDPEGQPAGTYLKLTIANQEDPVYINVEDLADIYTAQSGATQVQLTISAANEISATIVAGSVTGTELDSTVNASLTKADTALQDGDISTISDATIQALFA